LIVEDVHVLPIIAAQRADMLDEVD
jgi:hypothetical protein